MDRTPNPGLAMLLVAGFIWIAIAWVRRGLRIERERRAALAAYAVSRGWTYRADAPELVVRFVSHPFGLGSNRQALDAITGEINGREFCVFDYHYETHSVDAQGRRQTHRYLYRVLFTALPAYLPVVRFTPEGLGAKFVKAFGARDLEVESEAFNKRWRVWAQDERAAHAMLTPRMIDRFMQTDLINGSWILESGAMMLAESGRWDLSRLEARLGAMAGVIELIPQFVIDDFGAKGAPGA